MKDLLKIHLVKSDEDCDCEIRINPELPITHKIAYLEFVKQAICNTQELLQAEAHRLILDPREGPGPSG